eukprot:CAMPEP_0179069100 /NCGR_PEP_ID=MMETSP0796-20121207/30336_1 /TAXON_ID=73915 /ORGANISM="Pyrodinium bahamense, Strain pbaha01" /LENGTH=171 /DNA_ID=CAMNT_0020766161 /DNA_START=331 /DNA_END=843 /DNA_ORIENTATION=+
MPNTLGVFCVGRPLRALRDRRSAPLLCRAVPRPCLVIARAWLQRLSWLASGVFIPNTPPIATVVLTACLLAPARCSPLVVDGPARVLLAGAAALAAPLPACHVRLLALSAPPLAAIGLSMATGLGQVREDVGAHPRKLLPDLVLQRSALLALAGAMTAAGAARGVVQGLLA